MAHERTGLVTVTLITGSAAISGLLFGYDTAVVNGALVFLRAQFNLTAFQTELAATSLLWGCVLGAAMAGYLCDRYGRRRVLMLSGVLFVASAIGAALPTAAWQFLLARLVGGVAIGCASLVAPLYIAEISPAAIRGRLISIYQLAIVTGILAAYVSNYFVARLGQSSWRWMFGLGAIPATLLAQEEVIKRRELLVEGWLLEALGEVGPYLCAVEDPLARPHRIIGQTETGHVMRRNRNGKANTARRRFASGNSARRKHARRRG